MYLSEKFVAALSCVAFAVAEHKRIGFRNAAHERSFSEARLQDCAFEVVMFDTRNPTSEPSFMDTLVPDQYVSLTTVLNYAYAKKFAYGFRFVHMDSAMMRKNFSIPWHRVFYFDDRLTKEHTTSQRCTWFLYVDSDAFIRNFSTTLPAFIADIAARYQFPGDIGAIFAQEQVHPPKMPWTYHAVNAGVFLVGANARARHLFHEWATAATDDPQLEHQWPAEQGVLTELRFPGKYYKPLKMNKYVRLHEHGDIADDMALVNMTEMNSPWGRFVDHVWSGPGSELRATAYTSALSDIGLSEAHRFAEVLDEARAHVEDWAPKV